MTPPSREKCPNFKVNELFWWLRFLMKEAWLLGEHVLLNKQTCKIQDKTIYTTCCGKCKRIGDGVQTDAIADVRDTADFYFQNKPVDNKWINMGMSLMHTCILHVFSGLRETGHSCKMDNLFNSVNLARQVYTLPSRVKTDGVIHKSGWGVPVMVLQEELKGKRADAVRGTLKVAVLKGDSKSCNLIVVSNYNQKPF